MLKQATWAPYPICAGWTKKCSAPAATAASSSGPATATRPPPVKVDVASDCKKMDDNPTHENPVQRKPSTVEFGYIIHPRTGPKWLM